LAIYKHAYNKLNKRETVKFDVKLENGEV